MGDSRSASLTYVAAVIVLAVLAVASALWMANGRPLTTYDSAFYVSAARHVAAGDGFITDIVAFDDDDLVEPLKRWPPLYPLLMAPFIMLGVSGLDAGTWVSALAFAATVAGVAEAARRAGGRLAGVIAGALTLTATAFWNTATSLGSDMLYVALGAWSMAELVAYAKDRREPRIWTSAAFAALATLTRWVGFTLGIAGALWLGLDLLRRREWRGLWRPVAYGLLVVGPTVVLQLFNPIGSGEAALRPSTGQAPPLETLRDIALTAGVDLGLWPLPPGAAAAGLFALRWLAVAALLYMVLRSAGPRRRDTGLPALVLPGGAYVVVYCAVVAYTRSIQYVPGIVTRYVTPIYPVFFAALGVCAAALIAGARRRRGLAALVLLGVALTFAAVPLWTGMAPAARAARRGAGLSAERWREGEGFALVRRLAPDTVVSPTAGYVYLLTGVPSRPPDIGWDAEDILRACAAPPLRDLDVLVLIADPDASWVRDAWDVEGLLDPARFDVLMHTERELVVRPKR